MSLVEGQAIQWQHHYWCAVFQRDSRRAHLGDRLRKGCVEDLLVGKATEELDCYPRWMSPTRGARTNHLRPRRHGG